jgi:hypothetical protein
MIPISRLCLGCLLAALWVLASCGSGGGGGGTGAGVGTGVGTGGGTGTTAPTLSALLGNWQQVPLIPSIPSGYQYASNDVYMQGGGAPSASPSNTLYEYAAGRSVGGNQLQVFELTSPVASNGGYVSTRISTSTQDLLAVASTVVAGSGTSARTDITIGRGAIRAGNMSAVRFSWPGGLFGRESYANRIGSKWCIDDSRRALIVYDDGVLVRSADPTAAGLAEVSKGYGGSDLLFTGWDSNGRLAYHAILRRIALPMLSLTLRALIY